jgi:hypothetical protein
LNMGYFSLAFAVKKRSANVTTDTTYHKATCIIPSAYFA